MFPKYKKIPFSFPMYQNDGWIYLSYSQTTNGHMRGIPSFHWGSKIIYVQHIHHILFRGNHEFPPYTQRFLSARFPHWDLINRLKYIFMCRLYVTLKIALHLNLDIIMQLRWDSNPKKVAKEKVQAKKPVSFFCTYIKKLTRSIHSI